MDLIRGMSVDQLAAIRRSTFYPNLAIFVDWPGDPLRFHFGRGDLLVEGEIYSGFGNAASLSLPSESPSIAAAAGSLSIAGVDIDLDGQIDTPVRGRAVTVHMLFMTDRATGPRIGPPIQLFRGTIGATRMRTSKVDDLNLMSTIEVDLTTGPSARAESSIFHSNEDQSRAFPGDTAGRLTILAYSNAQKMRWPE